MLSIKYKITALEKNEEKVLMRLHSLEKTIASLAQRQREPAVPLKTTTTTTTTTTTEPPSLDTWVYYPPESNEFRARKYYPDRRLRFVGFGCSSKHSRTYPLTGRGITLERCLDVCAIVRKNAGPLWN